MWSPPRPRVAIVTAQRIRTGVARGVFQGFRSKAGEDMVLEKNIFGSQVEMLPMAFGDFNSDKLTDLFVIDNERNKLSILLAQEQTFSLALTSHTYFQFPSEVDKKKLKLACTLNNVLIESVIPGDFDGDGGMDVFVTVKNPDDKDDAILAERVRI